MNGSIEEEDVLIDERDRRKRVPSLQLDSGDAATASVLQLFLAFFGSGLLAAVVTTINKSLPGGELRTDRAEVLKWIGILIAMALTGKPAGGRRWFWSDKNTGIRAPPDFGGRFKMGVNRWELLLRYMGCVHSDDVDKTDPWWRVRPWVTWFNRARAAVVTAGWLLCCDESFSSWLGADADKGRVDGAPKVIKIKGKPKGIGIMFKNTACALPGIMLFLEIDEGAAHMKTKEFRDRYTATTATTLRICKPWFGSGRLVCADSWFASVTTAAALFANGLFFTGPVKTATAFFPMAFLKAADIFKDCARGAHKVLSTVYKRRPRCTPWRGTNRSGNSSSQHAAPPLPGTRA
jgi:hypothetical protein